MSEKNYYGGQAVIEGVMMRGRIALVTAVRSPKGDILTDTQVLSPFYTGPMRHLPFVRGIIVLVESLVLGIKSLMYSADKSLEDEGEKVSTPLIWLMMAVAFGIVVVLFFIVPLLLTKLLHIQSAILFNLVDGLIRVTIFVVYLRVMGTMRDLRRVFAYHGAEHKTVNAYEAGAELNVASVKRFSTAHVRCGTSFLFAVVIISVVVFALAGVHSTLTMALMRVLLVPVIAGISYELIYFAGRHSENVVARLVSKPGLWLQSLTTREPDDSQLEVAVTALQKVIDSERSVQTSAIQESNGQAESPDGNVRS